MSILSNFFPLKRHGIYAKAQSPDEIIPLILGNGRVNVKRLDDLRYIVGHGIYSVSGVYDEKGSPLFGVVPSVDFSNSVAEPITLLNFNIAYSGDVFVDIVENKRFSLDAIKLFTNWHGIHLDAVSDLLNIEIFAVIDTENTYRYWVEKTCENIGAVFVGGVIDSPCVFPIPYKQSTPAVDVNNINSHSLKIEVSLRDVVNKINVNFIGGSLSVENKESIVRVDVQEKTISADWLVSAKDASNLAHRICEWLSGFHCSVEIGINETGELQIGDTVSINHSLIPSKSGVVVSELTQLDGSMGLVIDCLIDRLGASKLIAESIKIKSKDNALTNTLVPRNGYTIFTILGENGQPLSGASVTLDDVTTKIANARGDVEFRDGIKGRKYFIEAILKGFTPVYYSGEW